MAWPRASFGPWFGFYVLRWRESINCCGQFSAWRRLCVAVLAGWALQGGRKLRYAVAFGSLKNGFCKQEDKW